MVRETGTHTKSSATNTKKTKAHALIRNLKREPCEKNISLFESIGKTMGKKTVKEKTKVEQQFDHVKSKIEGWEEYRKSGSQVGPLLVLFIGALITTAGLFTGFISIRFSYGFYAGIIVAIVGILIIIAAWNWSGKRSKGERDIEDKILNLKSDLSLLEKER
jgi:hypothetical protein